MNKPDLVEVLREISAIAKECESFYSFTHRLTIRANELLQEITEYRRQMDANDPSIDRAPHRSYPVDASGNVGEPAEQAGEAGT